MTIEPLDRARFDATKLFADHPPRWFHPNKQAVFEIACSSGDPFEGEILYSRWPEAPLPSIATSRGQFRVCPGVFTYDPDTTSDALEWHMNFADPHLFGAYSSALLAQDELQVAEHPILGSLRDALLAAKRAAATIDSRGRPTPVTISGVQRRCVIDTAPNLKAGRFDGLYGNAFARAPIEEIVAATRPLSPPTISHILAMAAPAYGRGIYSREHIMYVVSAAYSGFLGARSESEHRSEIPIRTVIHTGFWGCGAFGGNRVLMTILQSLAAELADVDLVFHAFDAAGVSLVENARDLYGRIRNSDSASTTSQVLDAIVQQNFSWGASDGT